MKQEQIDELMKMIDKKGKFPKNWDNFLKEFYKQQNIIIKDTEKKFFKCTNCNHAFYNAKMNIKDIVECPSCRKKLIVKSINESNISFKKSVILLQRIQKEIVIRIFEIYSYFDFERYSMKRSIQEYCRIVVGKGRFISDTVEFYYGNTIIYHNCENLYWRKHGFNKDISHFPIYPYNKTKLLKGTKLEYAPINEFLEKFSHYGFRFIEAIQFAGYESFELLWKLKLYNLSLYSKSLNKNGSFYKRFGVSKDFLPFMQENDIRFGELRILQILKKKDIKDIQYYLHTAGYNATNFLVQEGIEKSYFKEREYIFKNDIKILKKIKRFLPLKKLVNYKQGIQNLTLYKDYLEMAEKLNLNLKCKDKLFPENLIESHDQLQTQIKINDSNEMRTGIALQFLELSKYIYQDEKFVIFPPTSVEDFEAEGKQQNNCVCSMYMEKYKNKETEIYFIRKINDLEKSVVTLEFKNNKVVQKEQRGHRHTDMEQNEFIEKWIMYRSFITKKIKYQANSKNSLYTKEEKKAIA